ncbi:MAG TPA: cation diffusion facilitator family transporter [Micromonosporaceae bacterium]|jgi:cation diffusion facilitator family transporter
MSTSGGTRAIIAALLANIGIAVTKFVAYLLTGSSSMLAESIHSVADSGNQLLLLLGGRRAQRAATPQHPFGYGRERYIYAFIVSIVLFSVGGLFALYEAYHKFLDPHPIDSWQWVPVVVLVAAIVMEAYSFRTAIHESNAVRGGASWLQFVRRAKAPELPVILLEDLGALVGLAFALVGVGMTLLTDNGLWDAAGTAMIGLLLVTIAVILAIETKSLLLGEAATPEANAAIERAITAGPEIERIIHMRTLHLGPEELLVAAKIAVRHDETADNVARTIDAVEERIRAAVPIARVIYLEPDVYRPVAAEGDPDGTRALGDAG